MSKNDLRNPENRQKQQDSILDVKSEREGCSHPLQVQIEETGHVWQYCRGKNCHRKLFVRENQ